MGKIQKRVFLANSLHLKLRNWKWIFHETVTRPLIIGIKTHFTSVMDSPGNPEPRPPFLPPLNGSLRRQDVAGQQAGGRSLCCSDLRQEATFSQTKIISCSDPRDLEFDISLNLQQLDSLILHPLQWDSQNSHKKSG